MRRDAVGELTRDLARNAEAVLIVWYPDGAELPEVVAQVESLFPADPARVDDVPAAVAASGGPVLLLPNDEVEAVGDLDGSRDQLLEPRRKGPVVLFLRRGGGGERALATAPSLMSWVRGCEVDPVALAELGPADEAAFVRDTGLRPEAWLADWDARGRPTDPHNVAAALRARLLAGR